MMIRTLISNRDICSAAVVKAEGIKQEAVADSCMAASLHLFDTKRKAAIHLSSQRVAWHLVLEKHDCRTAICWGVCLA